MAQRLLTARLILRTWHIDDARAALDVFGHVDLARWLSPIMGQVPDLPAMHLLLQQWIVEDARAIAPAGRWCIQRQEDQCLIGGATLLPLPPGNDDLEIGWQLHPYVWGQGYARSLNATVPLGRSRLAVVAWFVGSSDQGKVDVFRGDLRRAACSKQCVANSSPPSGSESHHAAASTRARRCTADSCASRSASTATAAKRCRGGITREPLEDRTTHLVRAGPPRLVSATWVRLCAGHSSSHSSKRSPGPS